MPWATHETISRQGNVRKRQHLYAIAGEVFEPGAEVSLVDLSQGVIATRVIADELLAQEPWCWTHDRDDLVVVVNGQPLTQRSWSEVVGSAPLHRRQADDSTD